MIAVRRGFDGPSATLVFLRSHGPAPSSIREESSMTYLGVGRRSSLRASIWKVTAGIHGVELPVCGSQPSTTLPSNGGSDSSGSEGFAPFDSGHGR